MEWQLATINISSFFPNLELYYVKPKYEKQSADYSIKDIEDEGHPKLETVRTGDARQPLPHWMELENEKGKMNPQYLLFQTIFCLAQSIAREKGLDPLKGLDKVWVPIEEPRGLEEYGNRLREYMRSLPQNQRKNLESMVSDHSKLMKSISKYLTAVDIFRLFEVKRKSVRMTLRAAMLGQTLFG